MKKVISLLLAVLMLFSVLSIGASAEYRCPDDIHAWNHGTVQKYPATCTSRAYSVYECMYCSATLRQEYGPVAPHTDKDHNGRCDVCDEDRTLGCGHICHKGGIEGFFYKIALFFWKLFKTNKECSCGMYHY